MRLDQRLVMMGLATSRSRAQAMIREGIVTLNGEPARHASAATQDDSAIALTAAPMPWASRGALKLLHALDAFELSPHGARALDLGASTGGFTEALLARGAATVYSVDVGREQLAPKLRADTRVHDLSPLDARALTSAHLDGQPVDWITADLSFIGFAKAAAPALALARPAATLVALVKPQFEVGRAYIGKGGVVKDPAARARAVEDVAQFLKDQGWRVIGIVDSPIEGGDGNREALIGATAPE